MKLYILTFTNGKRYIGISSSPILRFKDHDKLARKGSMFPVHCAIRKYGWENVVKSIVREGERRCIQCAEIVFIRLLKTTDREFGYNVTHGGDISPMHSESVRARVTATKRAQGATPAMLAYAQRQVGRKATEEQRKNMSTAHLGKPWTDKQRAASSTVEYRQKRSAISKEVARRPGAKEARSAAQKGKQLSAEHYANLVMANRRVGRTPAKIAQLAAVHQGLRGKKRPEMAARISALRWITNGTERRRVPMYSVLAQGWIFGKDFPRSNRSRLVLQ